MVVYYSRVRLRRFLCDQYRPARLAHYFRSISSEGKRSRFLFGLVIGLGVQYSGNVYILQNSEGVHCRRYWNLFGRRKLGESGRCFLVLCDSSSCRNHMGIFLCSRNQRRDIGEDRGVLEKRRKAPSFEIKNNGKYPKNRLVWFIMVRYHNSWLICWKGSITRSSNLASRKDIS